MGTIPAKEWKENMHCYAEGINTEVTIHRIQYSGLPSPDSDCENSDCKYFDCCLHHDHITNCIRKYLKPNKK